MKLLNLQTCFLPFSVCKPPIPQIKGYKPYEPFIEAIVLIDHDNENKHYQYNEGIEYHDWLNGVTTNLNINETVCYACDKTTLICLEKAKECFNHINLTDILRAAAEHWIYHPHIDLDKMSFQ